MRGLTQPLTTEDGAPQDGPVSCVLANLYLHHTLDLWFEKKFKPQCQGEAYLVRFVDYFVGCFQNGRAYLRKASKARTRKGDQALS
jgi:hypothetical protein